MTSLYKKRKSIPTKPQSTQALAEEQIPISRLCVIAKRHSASSATSGPTQFSSAVFFPQNMQICFHSKDLDHKDTEIMRLSFFISSSLRLDFFRLWKYVRNAFCRFHFHFNLWMENKNSAFSDWITLCSDKYGLACASRLQTDIVYFPLHGVWMGSSIGHGTMRKPRHESLRLYTKEILLTPNHKKRGVKKKTKISRSPQRSLRVILRERNLCDIDRIVHNWRRVACAHQHTQLHQLSFSGFLWSVLPGCEAAEVTDVRLPYVAVLLNSPWWTFEKPQ